MNRMEQVPAKSEGRLSASEIKRLFGSDGNLEAIEALRIKQHEVYQEQAVQNINLPGISPAMADYYNRQAINETVTNYLYSHGIDRDNAQFNELHDGLIGLSIINIPGSDWSATLDKDDPTKTGISGRDRARDLYEQITGESYYARHDEQSEADQELLAEWRGELDDLRETLAKLSATRQGRVAGSGGEKYQQAKDAYNDQMIALAKLENEAIINSTELTDDEKKIQITEHLFAEQARLRQSTTEKLQNTKVGKFVEWMNRGRVATRIAKGLALGVGVGLAGAAVGALAGVAGIATIGSGVVAAGTATVRFARGFALRDAQKGRGMAELNRDNHTIESDLDSSDSTDHVDLVHGYLDNLFEQDTKLEQKKRRSSVKWGVGALAVGVMAAEAGQLAMDVHWFDGLMNHHDPLTSGLTHHAGTETANAPTVPSEITPPSSGAGEIIAPPTVAPEFDVAAHTVVPGEGWYQTFKDMGIEQDEWSNLLKKVGPTLQQRGLAYKMGNSWGISRPGQLSDDVLELIKNSR